MERFRPWRAAFSAWFGDARHRILIAHRTTGLGVADRVFVGVRDERTAGTGFTAGIAANILLRGRAAGSSRILVALTVATAKTGIARAQCPVFHWLTLPGSGIALLASVARDASTARDTFARRGIEMESFAAGCDTLIVTTDVAQPAIDINTGTAYARLTGGADVATTPTVVTIELRIDALPAADRAPVTAYALATGARLARMTDMAAGTAVVRVGIEADTLLIAAGGIPKTAAGVMVALRTLDSEGDGTAEDAANVLIAVIAVTSREITAVLVADLPDLKRFFSASSTIADPGRACRH
jgi:hypothetical protein